MYAIVIIVSDNILFTLSLFNKLENIFVIQYIAFYWTSHGYNYNPLGLKNNYLHNKKTIMYIITQYWISKIRNDGLTSGFIKKM